MENKLIITDKKLKTLVLQLNPETQTINNRKLNFNSKDLNKLNTDKTNNKIFKKYYKANNYLKQILKKDEESNLSCYSNIKELYQIYKKTLLEINIYKKDYNLILNKNNILIKKNNELLLDFEKYKNNVEK